MSSNKEYNRNYYLKHREERRERHNRSNLEYYHDHKEEINERRREPRQRKTAGDRREWVRAYERELRIEVLTHYGQGKLACAACGEDRLPCLTIDHINNDGATHRKEIKISIYKWLKRNNYPDGFLTLCMNCQWVKKAEAAEAVRGVDKT